MGKAEEAGTMKRRGVKWHRWKSGSSPDAGSQDEGGEEVGDTLGEEGKMGGKRLDEREGKLKGKEGGDVNGDCGGGRQGERRKEGGWEAEKGGGVEGKGREG